jgi:peptidyl-prolyl cis-trans isomerase C
MKPVLASLLLVVTVACRISSVFAEDKPDEVLAENATVKLTRADFEAELQRLPAEYRGAFVTDPKRVTDLLNNMLLGMTLAAEARKAGLDRDPVIQRRMALAADKVLAEAEGKRIEALAGAEFDAKAAEYLPKARERYLVGKEKFFLPEQRDASHILILTEARSEAEAAALAEQVETKIAAGADFAALAREFSDDKVTKVRGGHIGWFTAKQMDPDFAGTAFALKKVGDISTPVQSKFGYHIIRLDGIHPARQQTFDEVKEQLIAEMREKYIVEQRALKIAALRDEAALKVNQAAIDSLIVPMPDSATLRRLMQQGGKPQ